MNPNPYTLVFGREPAEIIARTVLEEEIMQAFQSDYPSQQVFMITGVRGIGKTVFMTNMSKKIKSLPNWTVVELNPERDLLNSLASKLSSNHSFAKLFQKASINLSFFGFGLEVKNTAPVTDIELAVGKMLESLKRKGQKILITIDEVSNSKNMRTFASTFQILLRQELPVYLLMTGLYENINELQNEKNLTFLYRAPKIELGPLNLGTIAHNYKVNFDLSEPAALQMAKLTKGYSFAFQVLGYLTWKNNGDYQTIIPQYKQYLEEYVYEKLWSELSATDKRVAYGLASTQDGKIAQVRENISMSTNQFNPYRRRLIHKGIISGPSRGYIAFTLPLFREFVLEVYEA